MLGILGLGAIFVQKNEIMIMKYQSLLVLENLFPNGHIKLLL
jgi:hypothetical protein